MISRALFSAQVEVDAALHDAEQPLVRAAVRRPRLRRAHRVVRVGGLRDRLPGRGHGGHSSKAMIEVGAEVLLDLASSARA